MKITSLKIRNYRTLESTDLVFPSSYTAICGANDAGKTNVVRAIRALVKEEEGPASFLEFPGEEELSLKDDYPKWKDTEPAKREIVFEIMISLDKGRDVGFYQFVAKQLSINTTLDSLDLSLAVTYRADRAEPAVVVTAAENKYSDLNAQEVLKKLQSSKSILFHNSTQVDRLFMFRGGGGRRKH